MRYEEIVLRELCCQCVALYCFYYCARVYVLPLLAVALCMNLPSPGCLAANIALVGRVLFLAFNLHFLCACLIKSPLPCDRGLQTFLSEGHISYYSTVRGPDNLRNVIV